MKRMCGDSWYSQPPKASEESSNDIMKKVGNPIGVKIEDSGISVFSKLPSSSVKIFGKKFGQVYEA